MAGVDGTDLEKLPAISSEVVPPTTPPASGAEPTAAAAASEPAAAAAAAEPAGTPSPTALASSPAPPSPPPPASLPAPTAEVIQTNTKPTPAAATTATTVPLDAKPQPPSGLRRESSSIASAFSEPEPSDPSFTSQLKKGDKHWTWKVGIRSSLCVIDTTGIGCAGWVVANGFFLEASGWRQSSYFADKLSAVVALALLSASLIWGIAEMLLRFVRRPLRPIHPGVVVGADLILWIALLCAVAFSIPAVQNLQGFGSNANYLADPIMHEDYAGHYFLDKSTDTWVYNITGWKSTEDKVMFDSGSGVGGSLNLSKHPVAVPQRNCVGYWEIDFGSCEAQDAFVNNVWRQKPVRIAVDTLFCIAEVIALVGHFTLFVWACIETHHRNRIKPARLLAREMVADMIDRGDIVLVRGRGGEELGFSPQPPEFTPVPAHLRSDEYPSHWEAIFRAYDPSDRPRGGRRAVGPHVPFQLAPYILPYGRRTPRPPQLYNGQPSRAPRYA